MSERGIFRPCQALDGADAGCIGKSGNAAVAEKRRRIAPRRLLGPAHSGGPARSGGCIGGVLRWCWPRWGWVC